MWEPMGINGISKAKHLSVQAALNASCLCGSPLVLLHDEAGQQNREYSQ